MSDAIDNIADAIRLMRRFEATGAINAREMMMVLQRLSERVIALEQDVADMKRDK